MDEFLDRFATGLRSQLFQHEGPAIGYANGAFDAVPRDSEAAARAEPLVQPALRLLEQIIADDGTAVAPAGMRVDVRAKSPFTSARR